MSGKIDLRMDGIPKSQHFRALRCIHEFNLSYPDSKGADECAIYVGAYDNPQDALVVYRTKGGRLVCKMLLEELR